MKNKVRLTILFAIIIAIIISLNYSKLANIIYLLVKFPFVEILDNYLIFTPQGDKFYVTVTYDGVFEPSSGICLETDDNGKRKEIFYADGPVDKNSAKKIERISFDCVYNTPSICCYDYYSNNVLCRIKSTNKFINFCYDAEFPNFPDLLLPFANDKFSTGEWLWVNRFSKYLAKNNYSNVISTLKRYSKGNFTKSELTINKNNKTTLVEMQNFAKEILKSQNIMNTEAE